MQHKSAFLRKQHDYSDARARTVAYDFYTWDLEPPIRTVD